MKYMITHIRQSLSLKLSVGYLLTAILIFVSSLGLLYMQSRHIIRQEAKERTMAELNTSLQRIQRYLGTIETATNANAWIVEQNLHPDSLIAYSRRLVLLNRHVNGCSITTEPFLFPQYGRYFSAYSIVKGDSVETQREGEYEYFEKEWYKHPKALGKACWIEPFSDYNEGTLYTSEVITSYCKPLYRDNLFVGVISTDLSLRLLSKAVEGTKPYPNSYYIMLGKQGHYYIHPDSTRLFHSTIFSDVDPREQPDLITLGYEMTAGKQGTIVVEADDEAYLVCYHPVSGTNWSIALVVPDSDILHSYYKLTLLIILLVIVGLFAIVLLCRRAVNHAIKPLSKLLELSQQITAGHYDVQIAHSDRKDAVGRLQNSFATMQGFLNRHVNDIQQANEATLHSNKELAKATQMAKEANQQKLTFIQNMSHQLRTPLNIIMGFAQVIRDSTGLLAEDDAKNVTEMMDHNAKTLNRMVLMLYDSSDTGRDHELTYSNQREMVSCNEMAHESIRFACEHFPTLDIKFKTNIPDDLCINTNRLYFLRSLREILYNSAKYSDGQNITLRVNETENTVRFVLEDTGNGIPESYLDKMYTPFSKGNDLSEGLGLGLPLTMRHVSQLGGRMTLDTDYKGGCRFIIEMPKDIR